VSDVAVAMGELASRNPVPSVLGAAAFARGLAAGDPDLLVEAVDRYRASPRGLDGARAASLAAVGLRRAGRRQEAAAMVGVARDAFLAAGATGDLERLEGARRRAPRPTFGWESLTPAEHEVVTLLQDGRTNRQIGEVLGISRRTVETHLSHAFLKIGVTTRVQLAAEAARREASAFS
jgi:DNA-binding CsgD family transcriptional regulator